jgi:hypothetical protein
MCVLKQSLTMCVRSLGLATRDCFNTLPFYALVFSPLTYHPVGRPH